MHGATIKIIIKRDIFRSQWSRVRVGLRQIACRDYSFESHRGHGCLSVASVVLRAGRDLCDGLITQPEESYRLRCVVVCNQETS